ncbi:MAG: beta-ketoacyl synthase N-terminal-like domain-containing protein, partial [Verrucomicrobiota bacterium]
TYPVSLTDTSLQEFTEWSRAPRMRRSSHISYFLIEAARQALAGAPHIDLSRTGVVVSFFLGCIDYSVRFYRQMNKDGRRFASPILFPETVFNSPISHAVSILGLGGPVYSQIGDKASWASALRTAECWLRNKTADNVLVISAEEFDPHELDAFEAAGWLKRGNLIPSSGAGALLFSRMHSSSIQISNLSDGNVFFSRKDGTAAVRRGLSSLA